MGLMSYVRSPGGTPIISIADIMGNAPFDELSVLVKDLAVKLLIILGVIHPPPPFMKNGSRFSDGAHMGTDGHWINGTSRHPDGGARGLDVRRQVVLVSLRPCTWTNVRHANDP